MPDLPEKVFDSDGDEWTRGEDAKYRSPWANSPATLAQLQDEFGPLAVPDDGQDTPGTQYRDRDRDIWTRDALGGYRTLGALPSITLARLRERYGPLTRIYEPPTDTADQDTPPVPRDIRREALALAREWASEDTDNRIGDRPGVAMTYARFLIGEDRS